MNKPQQDSLKYEVEDMVDRWPWWIKLLVFEKLRREGIEDSDVSHLLDEV